MKDWSRCGVAELRPGNVAELDGSDRLVTGWPKWDARAREFAVPTDGGYVRVPPGDVAVYR